MQCTSLHASFLQAGGTISKPQLRKVSRWCFVQGCSHLTGMVAKRGDRGDGRSAAGCSTVSKHSRKERNFASQIQGSAAPELPGALGQGAPVRGGEAGEAGRCGRGRAGGIVTLLYSWLER